MLCDCFEFSTADSKPKMPKGKTRVVTNSNIPFKGRINQKPKFNRLEGINNKTQNI